MISKILSSANATIPILILVSFVFGAIYNIGFFSLVSLSLLQFLNYVDVIFTAYYFLGLNLFLMALGFGLKQFRREKADSPSYILAEARRAKKALIGIAIVSLFAILALPVTGLLGLAVVGMIPTYLSVHALLDRRRLAGEDTTYQSVAIESIVVAVWIFLAGAARGSAALLGSEFVDRIHLENIMEQGRLVRATDKYIMTVLERDHDIYVVDYSGRAVVTVPPAVDMSKTLVGFRPLLDLFE